MHLDQIATLTPYQDVNEILVELVKGLDDSLGERLVGFYLTGSLTYGGFDRGSSDIDYLVVMDAEITDHQRSALAALHGDIGVSFPEWRERIEGSYVTRDMLPSTIPPPQGRPYINQGAFWDPDPPYGNEWLLNLYVLRECGLALFGPAPEELIGPVAIQAVQEASKRDLMEDWLPKAKAAAFFEDSHTQAYVTLTLCRILHRAANDGVASKRAASAWVKETCGEPWRSLIERAEAWSHGEDMNSNAEVRDFIHFTARKVNRHEPS